jgi:hypothetical protein
MSDREKDEQDVIAKVEIEAAECVIRDELRAIGEHDGVRSEGA